MDPFNYCEALEHVVVPSSSPSKRCEPCSTFGSVANLPYVTGYLQGTQVDILIDSGAAVNLIPLSLALRIPLIVSPSLSLLPLRLANGDPCEVHSTVRASLTLGSQVSEITALVLPHLYDDCMVVGSPTLSALKWSIDLPGNCLRREGELINFTERRPVVNVQRATLQRAMNIPAQSSVIARVTLPPNTSVTAWLVCGGHMTDSPDIH